MVVGAIHTRLTMQGDEMTERVCRALANPALTILAHPTGRLLQRREPFNADMDKIIATAGAHDVVMEINSHPWRLDLDWRRIRQARAAGCRFSIDPDSHNTLGLTECATASASRAGWLTADDVINTMSAQKLASGPPRARKSGLEMNQEFPLRPGRLAGRSRTGRVEVGAGGFRELPADEADVVRPPCRACRSSTRVDRNQSVVDAALQMREHGGGDLQDAVPGPRRAAPRHEK